MAHAHHKAQLEAETANLAEANANAEQQLTKLAGETVPSQGTVQGIKMAQRRCIRRLSHLADVLAAWREDIQQLKSGTNERKASTEALELLANAADGYPAVLANAQTLRARLEDALDARGLLESSSDSDSSHSSAAAPLVELPEWKIPKFNGDPRNYLQWWEAFNACVHTQSIPAARKCYHLHASLEGDARRAIAGFSLTAANYPLALARIQSKWGDKQVFSAQLNNELLSMATPANTVAALDEFSDEVERLLGQLQELGIGVNNDTTSAVIKSKLPTAVRESLAMKEIESGEAWDTSTLRTKLQAYIKVKRLVKGAGESISKCTQGPNPAPAGNGNRGRDQRHDMRQQDEPALADTRTFAAVVEGEPARKAYPCLFCDSTEHRSANCPEFHTVEMKRHCLDEKCLCMICLQAGHGTLDCASGRVCTACRGPHHYLVCSQRQTNRSPSPGLAFKGRRLHGQIKPKTAKPTSGNATPEAYYARHTLASVARVKLADTPQQATPVATASPSLEALGISGDQRRSNTPHQVCWMRVHTTPNQLSLMGSYKFLPVSPKSRCEVSTKWMQGSYAPSLCAKTAYLGRTNFGTTAVAECGNTTLLLHSSPAKLERWGKALELFLSHLIGTTAVTTALVCLKILAAKARFYLRLCQTLIGTLSLGLTWPTVDTVDVMRHRNPMLTAGPSRPLQRRAKSNQALHQPSFVRFFVAVGGSVGATDVGGVPSPNQLSTLGTQLSNKETAALGSSIGVREEPADAIGYCDKHHLGSSRATALGDDGLIPLSAAHLAHSIGHNQTPTQGKLIPWERRGLQRRFPLCTAPNGSAEGHVPPGNEPSLGGCLVYIPHHIATGHPPIQREGWPWRRVPTRLSPAHAVALGAGGHFPLSAPQHSLFIDRRQTSAEGKLIPWEQVALQETHSLPAALKCAAEERSFSGNEPCFGGHQVSIPIHLANSHPLAGQPNFGSSFELLSSHPKSIGDWSGLSNEHNPQQPALAKGESGQPGHSCATKRAGNSDSRRKKIPKPTKAKGNGHQARRNAKEPALTDFRGNNHTQPNQAKGKGGQPGLPTKQHADARRTDARQAFPAGDAAKTAIPAVGTAAPVTEPAEVVTDRRPEETAPAGIAPTGNAVLTGDASAANPPSPPLRPPHQQPTAPTSSLPCHPQPHYAAADAPAADGTAPAGEEAVQSPPQQHPPYDAVASRHSRPAGPQQQHPRRHSSHLHSRPHHTSCRPSRHSSRRDSSYRHQGKGQHQPPNCHLISSRRRQPQPAPAAARADSPAVAPSPPTSGPPAVAAPTGEGAASASPVEWRSRVALHELEPDSIDDALLEEDEAGGPSRPRECRG